MAISISKGKFTLSKPSHLCAVGFGTGLMHPAPGTWGTLMGVAMYYCLFVVPQLSLLLSFAMVVIAFVFGVCICEKTSKDIGEHDHGAIVWDEIVGYFVTMLFVPATAVNMVLGFIAFRFFDIFKPWPIRAIDRKVKGGFGVMLDDIVAGILAAGVLYALQWII